MRRRCEAGGRRVARIGTDPLDWRPDLSEYPDRADHAVIRGTTLRLKDGRTINEHGWVT